MMSYSCIYERKKINEAEFCNLNIGFIVREIEVFHLKSDFIFNEKKTSNTICCNL